MKHLVLFVVILSGIAMFPSVTADADIQSTGFMSTYSPTEILDNSTIVMAFKTGSDVTTFQILWDASNNVFEPIRYYITGGTMHIYADCVTIFGSCDEADYTIPISANTNYICAVRWDLQDTAGDTPEVFCNGTEQTVTTVQVGDGSGHDFTASRGIGYTAFVPGNPFLGNYSYFSMCNSYIPNGHLQNITGSGMADTMLQYMGADYNCLHHYDFIDTIAFNPNEVTTVQDLMGSGSNGVVDVNAYKQKYVGGWLSRS